MHTGESKRVWNVIWLWASKGLRVCVTQYIGTGLYAIIG